MPGHVFAGWNTQPDGSGTAIGGGARIAVIGNVTLYAMWRPDFRTVAYRNTGATFGTPPPTLTAMRDSYVTVSGNTGSLQRTGALFAGWSTQQNSRGTQFQPGQTTRLSANLTLHPMWVNNTFTVAYNANGGSGTVPASHAFAGGTYVRIAENTGNLQRDGYVFASWQRNPDGGSIFTPGSNIQLAPENLFLFPRWMPIEVTVNYHANGGIGAVPESHTIVGNGLIVIRSPGNLYHTGYEFKGWNTRSDGMGTMFEAGQLAGWRQIGQTTTLFAIWGQPEHDIILLPVAGFGTLHLSYESAVTEWANTFAPMSNGVEYGAIIYSVRVGGETRYFMGETYQGFSMEDWYTVVNGLGAGLLFSRAVIWLGELALPFADINVVGFAHTHPVDHWSGNDPSLGADDPWLLRLRFLIPTMTRFPIAVYSEDIPYSGIRTLKINFDWYNQ